MKYILITVLAFFSINIFATHHESLISEAYEDIICLMNTMPNEPSLILYEEFYGNFGTEFTKVFKVKLSQDKGYSFINEQEQKRLFSEQLKLSDPIYDNMHESPTLKSPKWLLTGEANLSTTRKYWKKLYLFEVSFSLLNIQNGTNDFIYAKSFKRKWSPPIFITVIIIIGFLGILRYIVFRFKGYYALQVYISGTILLLIYLTWIFI
ncbi:MAG TPA: hypothetical protein PL063_03650 [Candidatus Cloacimonadota bacterium]|jgi:hypothetical protein|nr:hypothetical protein [Candidatus Cloacimonadales bacterium]HPY96284.1 hypothetical protein [Candidatus Cloacimonadota bacterium]HQB40208.1 hypothetical protein [Candidatus Cloacimonadota bacterium]